ncbi:MAG: OmpH family outer membrane protein [Bacteroidaceae bacterium]|nr:OmpH family outer membrane protein [Bacteroidales bacterium]MBP3671000.1 OmpH family outer membrane protein [Bacteroidaceae bacterium]MBQ2979325.1 OmpH family outer membrane protein [Bacteroidaceae bacterium]
MKRLIISLSAIILCIASASAQKYALIDMEYILKNIPAYEMANEQLNQVAKRWQKECEDLASEAEVLFKNYQADMVFLTDEMKQQRADEVKAKEEEVMELRRKYFGPEGELYKKRESLMKPIQDDIYNAVKKLSEERGYMMVIDRASSTEIIFASPKADISNDVLAKLGYSK